jgi:hypothetical protein
MFRRGSVIIWTVSEDATYARSRDDSVQDTLDGAKADSVRPTAGHRASGLTCHP